MMGTSTKMTEADAAAGGGSPASKAETAAARMKAEDKPLTKRQRRKQPSEKNLLPQMPKIQSPAARAKAYLRVAGLNSSNKKSPLLVDPELDLHSPQVKFGRLLGATDQRIRHQAVLSLQHYLTARCDIEAQARGISELELLKLWKGLWYTLYMADKVPVQDELCAQIVRLLWCVAGTEEEDEYAGQAYIALVDGQDEEEEDEDGFVMEEIVNALHEGSSSSSEEDVSDREQGSDGEDASDREVGPDEEDMDDQEEQMEDEMDEQMEDEMDNSEIPHCRGAHLASMFVRTFFRTIRREWGKMDKWRVDKFYTLLRLMLHEVYKYMAVRHWNLGIIRLFNDAIFEEVLSQTPNGLRYHLIDICLDELTKVQATEAPMPLTEATFLDTLEPFFAMAQTGAGEYSIQERVMESVLSKFLDHYSVVSEQPDNSEDEDSLVFDQVHVGTVAQFIFDIASDGATKDQYRKSLYDLHKKYMRRLKQVGRDVELVDNGDGEDLDEIDAMPAEEDDYEIKDTNEADADADVHDSKEEKKKKKKEKKTRKRDSGEPTEEDGPEIKDTNDADADIHDSKEKKKKKSKKEKKKRKRDSSEGAAVEIADATTTGLGMKEETLDMNDTEVATKNKKIKKKKNKKRRESEDSAASSLMDETPAEETITISIQDQKTARAALQPWQEYKEEHDQQQSKRKRKKERKSDKDDAEANRRVCFDNVNRARSWKASMQGLRKMDVPPTPNATPEKSILRKGLTVIPKRGNKGRKQQRKRAIDYF